MTAESDVSQNCTLMDVTASNLFQDSAILSHVSSVETSSNNLLEDDVFGNQESISNVGHIETSHTEKLDVNNSEKSMDLLGLFEGSTTTDDVALFNTFAANQTVPQNSETSEINSNFLALATQSTPSSNNGNDQANEPTAVSEKKNENLLFLLDTTFTETTADVNNLPASEDAVNTLTSLFSSVPWSAPACSDLELLQNSAEENNFKELTSYSVDSLLSPTTKSDQKREELETNPVNVFGTMKETNDLILGNFSEEINSIENSSGFKQELSNLAFPSNSRNENTSNSSFPIQLDKVSPVINRNDDQKTIGDIENETDFGTNNPKTINTSDGTIEPVVPLTSIDPDDWEIVNTINVNIDTSDTETAESNSCLPFSESIVNASNSLMARSKNDNLMQDVTATIEYLVHTLEKNIKGLEISKTDLNSNSEKKVAVNNPNSKFCATKNESTESGKFKGNLPASPVELTETSTFNRAGQSNNNTLLQFENIQSDSVSEFNKTTNSSQLNVLEQFLNSSSNAENGIQQLFGLNDASNVEVDVFDSCLITTKTPKSDDYNSMENICNSTESTVSTALFEPNFNAAGSLANPETSQKSLLYNPFSDLADMKADDKSTEQLLLSSADEPLSNSRVEGNLTDFELPLSSMCERSDSLLTEDKNFTFTVARTNKTEHSLKDTEENLLHDGDSKKTINVSADASSNANDANILDSFAPSQNHMDENNVLATAETLFTTAKDTGQWLTNVTNSHFFEMQSNESEFNSLSNRNNAQTEFSFSEVSVQWNSTPQKKNNDHLLPSATPRTNFTGNINERTQINQKYQVDETCEVLKDAAAISSDSEKNNTKFSDSFESSNISQPVLNVTSLKDTLKEVSKKQLLNSQKNSCGTTSFMVSTFSGSEDTAPESKAENETLHHVENEHVQDTRSIVLSDSDEGSEFDLAGMNVSDMDSLDSENDYMIYDNVSQVSFEFDENPFTSSPSLPTSISKIKTSQSPLTSQYSNKTIQTPIIPTAVFIGDEWNEETPTSDEIVKLKKLSYAPSTELTVSTMENSDHENVLNEHYMSFETGWEDIQHYKPTIDIMPVILEAENEDEDDMTDMDESSDSTSHSFDCNFTDSSDREDIGSTNSDNIEATVTRHFLLENVADEQVSLNATDKALEKARNEPVNPINKFEEKFSDAVENISVENDVRSILEKIVGQIINSRAKSQVSHNTKLLNSGSLINESLRTDYLNGTEINAPGNALVSTFFGKPRPITAAVSSECKSDEQLILLDNKSIPSETHADITIIEEKSNNFRQSFDQDGIALIDTTVVNYSDNSVVETITESAFETTSIKTNRTITQSLASNSLFSTTCDLGFENKKPSTFDNASSTNGQEKTGQQDFEKKAFMKSSPNRNDSKNDVKITLQSATTANVANNAITSNCDLLGALDVFQITKTDRLESELYQQDNQSTAVDEEDHVEEILIKTKDDEKEECSVSTKFVKNQINHRQQISNQGNDILEITRIEDNSQISETKRLESKLYEKLDCSDNKPNDSNKENHGATTKEYAKDDQLKFSKQDNFIFKTVAVQDQSENKIEEEMEEYQQTTMTNIFSSNITNNDQPTLTVDSESENIKVPASDISNEPDKSDFSDFENVNHRQFFDQDDPTFKSVAVENNGKNVVTSEIEAVAKPTSTVSFSSAQESTVMKSASSKFVNNTLLTATGASDTENNDERPTSDSGSISNEQEKLGLPDCENVASIKLLSDTGDSNAEEITKCASAIIADVVDNAIKLNSDSSTVCIDTETTETNNMECKLNQELISLDSQSLTSKIEDYHASIETARTENDNHQQFSDQDDFVYKTVAVENNDENVIESEMEAVAKTTSAVSFSSTQESTVIHSAPSNIVTDFLLTATGASDTENDKRATSDSGSISNEQEKTGLPDCENVASKRVSSGIGDSNAEEITKCASAIIADVVDNAMKSNSNSSTVCIDTETTETENIEYEQNQELISLDSQSLTSEKEDYGTSVETAKSENDNHQQFSDQDDFVCKTVAVENNDENVIESEMEAVAKTTSVVSFSSTQESTVIHSAPSNIVTDFLLTATGASDTENDKRATSDSGSISNEQEKTGLPDYENVASIRVSSGIGDSNAEEITKCASAIIADVVDNAMKSNSNSSTVCIDTETTETNNMECKLNQELISLDSQSLTSEKEDYGTSVETAKSENDNHQQFSDQDDFVCKTVAVENNVENVIESEMEAVAKTTSAVSFSSTQESTVIHSAPSNIVTDFLLTATGASDTENDKRATSDSGSISNEQEKTGLPDYENVASIKLLSGIGDSNAEEITKCASAIIADAVDNAMKSNSNSSTVCIDTKRTEADNIEYEQNQELISLDSQSLTSEKEDYRISVETVKIENDNHQQFSDQDDFVCKTVAVENNDENVIESEIDTVAKTTSAVSFSSTQESTVINSASSNIVADFLLTATGDSDTENDKRVTFDGGSISNEQEKTGLPNYENVASIRVSSGIGDSNAEEITKCASAIIADVVDNAMKSNSNSSTVCIDTETTETENIEYEQNQELISLDSQSLTSEKEDYGTSVETAKSENDNHQQFSDQDDFVCKTVAVENNDENVIESEMEAVAKTTSVVSFSSTQESTVIHSAPSNIVADFLLTATGASDTENDKRATSDSGSISNEQEKTGLPDYENVASIRVSSGIGDSNAEEITKCASAIIADVVDNAMKSNSNSSTVCIDTETTETNNMECKLNQELISLDSQSLTSEKEDYGTSVETAKSENDNHQQFSDQDDFVCKTVAVENNVENVIESEMEAVAKTTSAVSFSSTQESTVIHSASSNIVTDFLLTATGASDTENDKRATSDSGSISNEQEKTGLPDCENVASKRVSSGIGDSNAEEITKCASAIIADVVDNAMKSNSNSSTVCIDTETTETNNMECKLNQELISLDSQSLTNEKEDYGTSVETAKSENDNHQQFSDQDDFVCKTIAVENNVENVIESEMEAVAKTISAVSFSSTQESIVINSLNNSLFTATGASDTENDKRATSDSESVSVDQEKTGLPDYENVASAEFSSIIEDGNGEEVYKHDEKNKDRGAFDESDNQSQVHDQCKLDEELSTTKNKLIVSERKADEFAKKLKTEEPLLQVFDNLKAATANLDDNAQFDDSTPVNLNESTSKTCMNSIASADKSDASSFKNVEELMVDHIFTSILDSADIADTYEQNKTTFQEEITSNTKGVSGTKQFGNGTGAVFQINKDLSFNKKPDIQSDLLSCRSIADQIPVEDFSTLPTAQDESFLQSPTVLSQDDHTFSPSLISLNDGSTSSLSDKSPFDFDQSERAQKKKLSLVVLDLVSNASDEQFEDFSRYCKCVIKKF